MGKPTVHKDRQRNLVQLVLGPVITALLSAIAAYGTLQYNLGSIDHKLSIHVDMIKSMAGDLKEVRTRQDELFQKYYVPTRSEWDTLIRDTNKSAVLYEELSKRVQDRIK